MFEPVHRMHHGGSQISLDQVVSCTLGQGISTCVSTVQFLNIVIRLQQHSCYIVRQAVWHKSLACKTNIQ